MTEKTPDTNRVGILLRSSMMVELIDSMGNDDMIVKAAKVSTLGAESMKATGNAGFINFLMQNRHGTPFEHGAMTFRIEAPIMVWREFMRHRIGFSYNEESGRYKQLDGVFYVPYLRRPLVQVGKPGQYTFEQGTHDQYLSTQEDLAESYLKSWETYKQLLDNGIAKEVARMCLPVAIFSSAYVTCNPRSLMSFLSLRTKSDIARYPSFPQDEIRLVAEAMENHFEKLFPITHAAFNTFGRVHP